MTATGPTPAGRALRAMLRMGLRRWRNRLTGQFQRRKKGQPAGRTATAPKASRGLLMLVFLPLFLCSAVGMSAAFLSRLGEAIENEAVQQAAAGKQQILVDHQTLEVIALDDEILKGFRTLQEQSTFSEKSKAAAKAAREAAESSRLPRLRERLLRDSSVAKLDKQHAETKVDEWMKVFNEKGADGFVALKPPFANLWYSWPAGGGAATALAVVAGLLTILVAALALLSLGSANQDLGRVEWSLEWLFTFPVSTPVLLSSQLTQYTLLNGMVWMTCLPFLATLLIVAGHPWAGVPLALAATLYLSALIGSFRLLGETWLRLRLGHSALKNLQALFTVLGTMLWLGVIYAVAAVEIPAWVLAAARHVGEPALWTPAAVPALLARSGAAWIAPVLAVLALLVAVPVAAVVLAGRLVQGGLTDSSGGAYAGRRGAAESATTRRPPLFKGIVGKEIKLLLRDRNFMAQTLVIPLLIVGFQVVIQPGAVDWLTDPAHTPTVAFICGAYVLMFGCFGVLASEGQALWLLFTSPRRIEQVMFAKAALWAAVGLVYPLAILGLAWFSHPPTDPLMYVNAALALVGLPIYAFIAAGIGVMNTNPLEETVQRKLKPAATYLYMMLASFYVWALYSPSFWGKFETVVLCALLAAAIWQKVRDRGPYLLDPTVNPPPRISLSDGLIAALAFFVLQSFILVIVVSADKDAKVLGSFVAYVVAGFVVTGISLAVFAWHKVPHIARAVGLAAPEEPHPPRWRAAAEGLAAGVASGAVGLAYTWAVPHIEPLRLLKENTPTLLDATQSPAAWWLIAILVVAAAPLVEEYIFRGLVYRGLRRSWGLWPSVLASAGIFAVVHPAISVLPVFVLGLCAALVFERNKTLLGPMLTHATSNALILIGLRGLGS